jgi:hypothetical protein
MLAALLGSFLPDAEKLTRLTLRNFSGHLSLQLSNQE